MNMFFSTRNWKQSQVYCYQCGQWYRNIQHGNCPLGLFGSLTWIDLVNFEMGCNKCNRTWPLEDNIFTCPLGHQQKTQYTDSVLTVEEGDQVIATDGDIVYVLTRSGTVVVGFKREFGPEIGYQQ